MKNPKNLVLFIEKFFGVELVSENMYSVSIMLEEDLDLTHDFFSELFDYLNDRYPFRERKKIELRPLIGYSFTNNPGDNIFYEVSLDGINIEYFKKILLYYDRVCLVIHTEFFFENFWDSGAIISFLEFIIEIKPLVIKEVVGFIAESSMYPETYDIEGYMNADVKGCQSLNLDYVTTYRPFWEILHGQNKIKKSKLELEVQTFLNSSMLSFDLPNLKKVSYRDIVEIRSGSEALMRLRSIFESLLVDLAIKKNFSPTDIEANIQYLIKHRFLEEKARLREELNKSSAKEFFKNSSLNFCISLGGLLIASSLTYIDMKDLLLLATGTSGPLAIVPYIVGKAEVKKKKLNNLYNICSFISEG